MTALRILVTRHPTTKLVGMWLDAAPTGGGSIVVRNPYTGKAEVLAVGQYC